MRSFLAGSFFLLMLAAASFAQVRGEVESIGFGDGYYRPECWTPMVVRLQSQVSDPMEYRIEVHQRDLDFDHVIYVKEGITLNGHAEQRWELCFLPEPTAGGLPDRNSGRSNAELIQDLNERLRVYLTNKDGTRQLLQLPITSVVENVDPPHGAFDHRRANKLVLWVSDGTSRPSWSEYVNAVGVQENVLPVPISDPRKLPQSVLAYQAVDAIVWLSGDAAKLSQEGSQQLPALQQWVRQGGNLVVCQPADSGRQNIEPFADMLPVVLKNDAGEWAVKIENKKDVEPLKSLAALRKAKNEKLWQLKGPFPFARATPKPNAVVEQWIDWSTQEPDKKKAKEEYKDPAVRYSPYIVRIPYGLGCVTWVAQDLGDPRVTGIGTAGWPYVWDRVFGWHNDTRIQADIQAMDEREKAPFVDTIGDGSVDLGASLLHGVEFGAKGAGLIVLALFFFIGYWIIAGPGTYLFLAGRKRKQFSWVAFAMSALCATAVTVLLVRLVLRGSADVHHVSAVKMLMPQAGQAPQPAIAYSRIGLYIPRDGDQRLEMPNTSPELVSYLSPMSIFPGYVNDAEFPASLEYRVPLHDEATRVPVAVDVPFRSTLKKLQAKWCGDISGGIRGFAKLGPQLTAKLSGTLDNTTGTDLKNVYFVFHDPTGSELKGSSPGIDYVLYLPAWGTGKNSRIDLAAVWAGAKQMSIGQGNTYPESGPNGTSVWGFLNSHWYEYWYSGLAKGGDQRYDDSTMSIPRSFPMLSLFDRLRPAEVEPPQQGLEHTVTLLRRGARNLNMSQAVAAGELVILAQANDRPLPFTFDVNGDQVKGSGTVYYQFAMPLDHGGLETPKPSADEEQQ